MTVVRFPRSKLPADAHAVGRSQEVMIYPHADGWTCYVAGEDTGYWLAEGVTKAEALAMGAEVALYWNAELVLRNRWERL